MKGKVRGRCPVLLALVAAFVLLIGSGLAESSATFRRLGVLPGARGSQASAVSADGSVVVGSSSWSGRGLPRGKMATMEAFVWTEGAGMVGLGMLPITASSHAADVSADGTTIVGYCSRSRYANDPPGWRKVLRAYRWTNATGMQSLSETQDLSPHSVCADGTVIAGTAFSIGARSRWSNGAPFRWTQAGGLQLLADFPGGGTVNSVRDISADGQTMVGGVKSPRGVEAFIWTPNEGLRLLGDLPGRTSASVVSGDGQIVAGSSATGSGNEPFIWTKAGGMVSLGTLPGRR